MSVAFPLNLLMQVNEATRGSDSIIGWRQGTLSTEEASVEKGEATTVLRGDWGKKKKVNKSGRGMERGSQEILS